MVNVREDSTTPEWSPETSGLSSARFYQEAIHSTTHDAASRALDTAGAVFLELYNTGGQSIVIPCGDYRLRVGLLEQTESEPTPIVEMEDLHAGTRTQLTGITWDDVSKLLALRSDMERQATFGKAVGKGRDALTDRGAGSFQMREGNLSDAFHYAISRM